MKIIVSSISRRHITLVFSKSWHLAQLTFDCMTLLVGSMTSAVHKTGFFSWGIWQGQALSVEFVSSVHERQNCCCRNCLIQPSELTLKSHCMLGNQKPFLKTNTKWALEGKNFSGLYPGCSECGRPGHIVDICCLCLTGIHSRFFSKQQLHFLWGTIYLFSIWNDSVLSQR